MSIKHYTIPIFIPELACPFQCIYCNQKKISGRKKIPEPEEIAKLIEEHLSTIPRKKRVAEIGFFGGNFTGIPAPEQEKYLAAAQPFLKNGTINSLRVSTRPDYINPHILDLLKKFNVKTIELGAQSFDNEVLKLSGRGYAAEDTVKSSELIKKHGFELGLQMMIGLPGDTLYKIRATAQQIADLGAKNARIYPTLVIKGTKLEEMYHKRTYTPLSMDEALRWSKAAFNILETGGVRVIRMGLHPSEGLISGNELVAGPFHQSFRELVLSEIWFDQLKKLTNQQARKIHIFVNPRELNYAIGYESKNKKYLLENFEYVVFQTDPLLPGRAFHVEFY